MERRIGAGLITVERGDITRVRADAVVSHLRRSAHPGRVILVGFDAAATDAFARALEAAGA